jgi:hypothetical protein
MAVAMALCLLEALGKSLLKSPHLPSKLWRLWGDLKSPSVDALVRHIVGHWSW